MEKSELQSLVSLQKSTWDIADETGLSQSTVRYWLRKHGLRTQQRRDGHLCKHCGETDTSKFVSRGHGRICRSVCKACHARYTIERFREYRRKAVSLKGDKCCRCGYNKCIGALEFHHRDPAKKDPKWRQMRLWKIERILKELEKCELVCSNCHREIHWSLHTGALAQLG